MTAAVSDTDPVPSAPPADDAAAVPATWRARALGLVVDVLPAAAVVTAMVLVALAVPVYGPWWWVSVSVAAAAILVSAANRVLLPSVTGWSLGRVVTGAGVVAAGEVGTATVGPGRLLLRELAHLLDTASVGVGWLWPLWDRRGRTFADLLVRTEVLRVSPGRAPRNVGALVAAVYAAVAAICVAGAAMSYLVVYRHDRSVDVARDQISVQGPKVVEQLLSYDPASLADDFARAQGLATDRYRAELIEQQQIVQQSDPVPNEYRSVNSSVLSAEPGRATMLLFLQGQRGDKDNGRFISATVRVDFAKSAGQWRVDDLTVVTKPLAEDGN